MTNNITVQYNQLLENISRELDISPSKYMQAIKRYNSVKKWLSDGKYDRCVNEPYIYLQGSFRFGTVVRPIKEGKESDYDIDLVCQLPTQKDLTKPSIIKSMVGTRLKENEKYKNMLDSEGCRCWTLNYAEEDDIGFHIDILPSIPEETEIITSLIERKVSSDIVSQAIAITHKKDAYSYSWRSSNPNGIADWFNNTKKSIFNKMIINERQRITLNNPNLFARADEIPNPLIKTPLQSAIQILKRHRDVRFAGHEFEDSKPISMVITILSAKLYQNEEDIYATLINIIEKLHAHAALLQPGATLNENIETLKLISRKQNGEWYIPNPVNPAENFADRWHENNHKKARAFFKWVKWIKNDLLDVLNEVHIKRICASLKKQFGEPIINRASDGLIFLASPTILTSSKHNTPHVHIDKHSPNKPYSNSD